VKYGFVHTDPVGDGDGLGVGDTLGLGLGLGDGDTDGDGETLGDGDGHGCRVVQGLACDAADTEPPPENASHVNASAATIPPPTSFASRRTITG
jgi:hypothetical protein